MKKLPNFIAPLLALALLLTGCAVPTVPARYIWTVAELVESVNGGLEEYNEENKYDPVRLLELEDGVVSCGLKQISFAFDTTGKDQIVEARIAFFGSEKTYSDGASALNCFLGYLSLFADAFSHESREEVFEDWQQFATSAAKAGGITASNGVTYEWEDRSTGGNYWYIVNIHIR